MTTWISDRGRRPGGRLAAALAVAFLTGAFAAPAAAQAPASPPASTPLSGLLETHLREVTDASQPAQAVAADLSRELSRLNQGLSSAMARGSSRGPKADHRAWAESWRAEQKRRWAALQARADALPEVRFTGPPPVDPAAHRRVDYLQKLPELTRALMTETVGQVTPLLDVAVQAASGDRAALRRLPADLTTASMATIRTENQLLRVQAEAAPADDPMRHLSNAAIASNEAVLVILEHRRSVLTGAGASPGEAAARIRVRIAEARAAADALSAWSGKPGPLETLDALRREAPDVHAKVSRAFTTFEESARVELLIADTLRSAADALSRGPAGEADLGARMNELGPLVIRRLKTHQDRLEIMGS